MSSTAKLTDTERERFDYWDYPGGGHGELIDAVERIVTDRLAAVEALTERCRGNYADPGTDADEPLRNYVLIEELRAALDAPAGTLAKRDAGVLRAAADEVYGDERAAGEHWHPLSIASWLRERASRIQAEAATP